MVAVSVLLLTKNGTSELESLLQALYSQKDAPSFEVVAIDSGSTDHTVPLLGRYPVRLVQIPAREFHHARTRNLAAGLASGAILVLLSQDAIPASHRWLHNLLVNFADPNVGAVYGRQLPKPGSLQERHETFENIYGPTRIVKDPNRPHSLGYRFFLFSDANAAIRKSVWQATQFPEHLKVFEDIGIAKRILDSGWKIVYEPQAAVVHSHNHDTVGLLKRYFDIGYTLKKLKIWDAPETRRSLARDARKILLRKFTGTRPQRRSADGLYKDLAKSLGLFLGINQACLPLALKRHLSAYHVFE